ncbi:MAG: hypothetical protein GEU79_14795 [Acidimicrobiia bacterium]|nr:hypothetical protein [Acidimicrobiia bacterium]
MVADDITTNSLNLSWPKAVDDKAVTGYQVYRDDVEIDRLGPSSQRLIVTGLSPDTSYRFGVRAFDSTGGSEPLTTRAITLSEACTTSRFDDVPCDHLFWGDVDWLAEKQITIGCNPPVNSLFCPDDSVSRGQMAAFLTRGLDLPNSGDDVFTDDNGTVFEQDIQALAASGITHGCNPPTNDHYCPGDPVNRGEMAAFLTRGLDLPTSDDDVFTDDNGTVFEQDIQALAASRITHGCNPPTNDHYCPGDPVNRGQMAAFLRRGLGG